ncbi:MAG: glutathione S-transferase N-terminal domain-containing protein [Pseudomonadota bacterium]
MKFYYSPGSCALASHIVLAEAGADYEPVRVDFSSDEQKQPDYLAINPKGRVPSLITDDGTLTETPAILAYLAQKFPEAGLAPLDNPFAFARAQEFNSYLCSTVHVAHAHKSRGKRWADDSAAIAEMTRKVPESVLAAFQLIEDGMLKGPWVLGEKFSICDAYLYTVAHWLEGDGIEPKSQLPRVAEHRDRVAERPAAKRAIAEHFG